MNSVNYKRNIYDVDGNCSFMLKYFRFYYKTNHFFFVLENVRAEETLVLYRNSLKSKNFEHDGAHFDEQYPHVFVILGASVSINKQTWLSRVTNLNTTWFLFIGWFSKKENLSNTLVAI